MTAAAGGASLQVSLPLQDLVEERRHVTVVFADLSGSTAAAEQQDPEETRDMLRACLVALARRVQRFGGTIDKYIGDAVMAVFGAPVTHEDDTERALRAALAMREAIDELNVDLRKRHGITLALRIGVNAGEVVAGVIAGDVQAAYTVVGDTVNMAQRLQVAARPGEIVVGVSARNAAPAFDFAPLAPLQVKGKDRPITAFRLLAAKAERPTRLTQHRLSSPLVGRDAELALLTSLVDRLHGGQGGAVAIIGEAGAGKSRLLAELKRAAASGAVTWLEGRCFTLGETTRYAPFVEALTHMAGIEDGDDDARRWSKLEARVRAVMHEDLDETVPYLAALIGIRPPEGNAAELQLMSGEAMGRQIFRATRRFLTALAQARPLVFAFEDLHWADASTAALIQHLTRATASAPLLVIGTSRPDPQSAAAELRRYWLGSPRYAEIRVDPLTDEQAAILIGNLLAVDDLPAQIRDVTIRRAEGNPLYVEEIIRTLIESGVVRREESSGRWRAETDNARIDLPDTIGGLILARLDRLDERSKQVLRHAAIIGRSFREPLLRAVDTGADLDRALAVLYAEDILVERRRAPDPEHMFKHVLIQQTVYESILKRQRREMHARVAQAIETAYADRIDEFVGALAYHYARAERWEEALAYLERAGDQAGQVAADAETVERYRDAMSAYEATGRASPIQIASLERKLGEALFREGDYLQAILSLRSALARLGAPLPSSRVGKMRAIAGQLLVQAAHLALPRLRRAPRADVPAAIQERTRVYQLLGWIDYYSSDPDRQILVSLLMLNRGERAGDVRGINQGLLGVGVACDILGFKRLASGYHRRNVAIAEASGDPIAIGYAYFGLAYHEHGIGEWDESEAYWGRGADAFWTTRDLRRWGVTRWGVALMKWRHGDTAGAREIAERMLVVAEEGAEQVLRGWGLYVLGRSQWSIGDDVRALASLRESSAILRQVPDRHTLLRALGDTGFCLLRQGDLAGATAVLEEVRELILQHSIRGFHSHVWHWLLEAYLEHAERAAGSERDVWLPKIRATIRSIERQGRVDAEAWPGLHRLRGRFEWLQGRRANAQVEWRKSLDWAERLRFVPELG
ncbi:MAG TPA: adenylate/guanylate cyclase domain-containing protein, partial [Candidatus Limnocylindria bacterium]|nr:adenylate/guanylate cyclase domain-containing protein [Candidatus Limnocylindria bacterium]